jgi:hypothetical protein
VGRGTTHPRDMKFLSIKSKGAQPKESIKNFGEIFGEQV